MVDPEKCKMLSPDMGTWMEETWGSKLNLEIGTWAF